jgi:hypothetical protein
VVGISSFRGFASDLERGVWRTLDFDPRCFSSSCCVFAAFGFGRTWLRLADRYWWWRWAAFVQSLSFLVAAAKVQGSAGICGFEDFPDRFQIVAHPALQFGLPVRLVESVTRMSRDLFEVTGRGIGVTENLG